MLRIFSGCLRRIPAVALQVLTVFLSGIFPADGGSAGQLEIVFLALETKIPAALSNLDPIIRDEGVPGAELAVRDNNTTGRFTGQNFKVTVAEVADPDAAIDTFRNKVKEGRSVFVTRLPSEVIRQIAALPESAASLILDISTVDDALRVNLCHPGILHIRPSRAMRTDALAQYMLKKRWRKWFLVIGPSPADALYADAVRRAAKRYGMTIVAEQNWQSSHDARRTAESEVPVLTQAGDYDVLVVADEQGLFGEYLAYRTWLPRPVIGTQGLVATAWDRNHEQWGAVQLQNRFRESAGRWMSEQDYTAWLAVRVIGEAATRTGQMEPESLKSFIRSPDFSVAGFKGKKLSFRSWNGQLRQPILLAAARSLVGVAPLEGFLHPKDELDSLGYDESEVECGPENAILLK
ncbi:MAG: ABC transporter substrate-binding protein [Methylococcaceae bacterium]|nr:ABC transporter substrate-binding protein [Methylococcaceae bacterium]MCI0667188.1 ABC transporter substrate-binding protein [Methylococcaceae bacterium]